MAGQRPSFLISGWLLVSGSTVGGSGHPPKTFPLSLQAYRPAPVPPPKTDRKYKFIYMEAKPGRLGMGVPLAISLLLIKIRCLLLLPLIAPKLKLIPGKSGKKKKDCH